MNRAVSLLTVKSVQEDLRLIEGIATTPTADRMEDIIETEGIEYVLPMPFLWQHDKERPIGKVVAAKSSADGITVKIQVAQKGIADYIDQAWSLIKAGLVQGLSIGFRPTAEPKPIKGTFGLRFPKTEWMELSAVTIPANQEASILTVKSADAEALAALGRGRSSVVRLANLPGVSGQTITPQGKNMNIQESIKSFENKRAASQARIEALIAKSNDEGRTLDESEKEEYKGLESEVSSIDEHLAILRKQEQAIISKATSVTQENTSTPDKAAATRRAEPIQVKSMAPKGIAVARAAIALHHAKGIKSFAADLARQHWPDSPEVELMLRAIVEAGDTTTSTWASQLVPAAQQASGEFLELLRAATLLGRIPGIRRVPFNIAVPVQTGAGTYNWVGEAAPKPVTSLTFSSVTLRWAKAAGIIVITQELAKFSNPSAEMIIRDEMIESLRRFIDAQFISTNAEVSNVSPAGILNGISATSTTGTTSNHFRADMNNLLNNFTANNVPLSGIVLLMSETQALALSLMITDLGVQLFPGMMPTGGTVMGMPVIVSEAVGTKIIAIHAPSILLAQDNGIDINVSQEATVEMETAPAVGEQSPPSTQSVLKSLWQNNLIGFRVEQFITWKRGRDAGVEYINANAYVPPAS